MTTRLEAMWRAVGVTRTDEEAIALVERETGHIGSGRDEIHCAYCARLRPGGK